MYNSIWSTPEGDAWARDFDYSNYVNVTCVAHNKNPVSQAAYEMFKQAFTQAMDDDMAAVAKRPTAAKN